MSHGPRPLARGFRASVCYNFVLQLDAKVVMEGTQPSTAGGNDAPTATVLYGSGASLLLRAKDYAAHDRWLVNLQDVITSNRLDDLWENQQVPTSGTWKRWCGSSQKRRPTSSRSSFPLR